MSIDVFGRHFKRAETIYRGPPGIEFQMTSDGNYNIQNKKLCNVTEARNSNDAVNLNLVQHMIQQEMTIIYDVIASLRTE